MRKDKLPKPQQAALEKIAQRSRESNQEWVTTSDIDPRPLNNLDAAGFITQHKQSDTRHARVTARGWAHLGQENPFLRPSADIKPMEAEMPDARTPNGKIMHGPYPKPNGSVRPSGITALVNPAPVIRNEAPKNAAVIPLPADEDGPGVGSPQPPDIDAFAPAGLKLDDARKKITSRDPHIRQRLNRTDTPDATDKGPGDADCADCADCIPQQVLTLVAAMYPEIADDVALIQRVKQVERDLERRGLLTRGGNGRNT